jgi:hypothetical protein
MEKKYWFYFGIGTKKGQVVHKNGVVGCDNMSVCPIIDIENSVMEEDQCPHFHVAFFKEVSKDMFDYFKKALAEERPVIVEEADGEIDVSKPAGGGLGVLGSLLGGFAANAAAGGDNAPENAVAEEVKLNTEQNGQE